MNYLCRLLVLCCSFLIAPSVAGQLVNRDVGIIMGAQGCPGGAAPLYVHIDNEDSGNSNNRAGWIGATVSNSNTTFYFCRVSGLNFHPQPQPYMVLSLAGSCPDNAQTIVRQFDGENRRPASSTNIQGLASGLPGDVVVGSNVVLYLCLFFPASVAYLPLPNLGVDYGLFAAPDFALASSSGWVYLDDQDPILSEVNDNRWCEDATYPYPGNRGLWNCQPRQIGGGGNAWTSPYVAYGGGSLIMDGGLNSVLRVVKISGPSCPNQVCSGGESCSTCPQDCGPCPYCGDLVCNGNESCDWCPDCGVCSVCPDGICTPDEQCTSCPDCGPCPFCGDGLCAIGEDCSSCCSDCGVCSAGQWCPLPFGS